jgi:hypothetical protein
MKQCWNMDPDARPSFEDILKSLRSMYVSVSDGLHDRLSDRVSPSHPIRHRCIEYRGGKQTQTLNEACTKLKANNRVCSNSYSSSDHSNNLGDTCP